MQLRATSQQKPAHRATGNILVLGERKQLFYTGNGIAANKIFCNGNVFAGGFAGAAAKRKKIDHTRPAYIWHTIQRFMPPIVVNFAVVISGYLLLEFFTRVPAQ